MSGENKKTVQIDIIFDVICPWCYVGKRRIEEAIKQSKELYPNLSYKIEWFPYLLDPSLTTDPQPKKERLIEKFGEAKFNSNVEILIKIGKEVGINFNHDGLVAQTYDAHRLINYAKSRGKQEEIIEELFHIFHEEGKNPADHEVLSKAAASVGLDKEKVSQFLKSEEGIQQVKEETSQALKKVSVVPHVTINNKIDKSGAQESNVYLEAFEQISKE